MQIKNELNNPQDSIQAKKEKPFWNPLFPWLVAGISWYIVSSVILSVLPSTNSNFTNNNLFLSIVIGICFYAIGGIIVGYGVYKTYKSKYSFALRLFLSIVSGLITCYVGFYLTITTIWVVNSL